MLSALILTRLLLVWAQVNGQSKAIYVYISICVCDYLCVCVCTYLNLRCDEGDISDDLYVYQSVLVIIFVPTCLSAYI